MLRRSGARRSWTPRFDAAATEAAAAIRATHQALQELRSIVIDELDRGPRHQRDRHIGRDRREPRQPGADGRRRKRDRDREPQ